jgi:hypothetical protein
LTLSALSAPCHDNYSAASFEEAGEDLEEFIDEYFVSAKIPFFPEPKNYPALKLVQQADGEYSLPHALQKGGGNRLYPTRPGLWQVIDHGTSVREYHLLICEPQPLTQTEAFNTYNDLLGEPYADYDDEAYGMTLQPEAIRRQSAGRYFTISVTVYGLLDDATRLPRTCTDVIITDYTAWVDENTQCHPKSHAAGASQ